MTPINEGATEDHPGTTPPGPDGGATFGTAIALPLPQTDRLPGLPTPAEVRTILRDRLELAVQEHRKAHGPVRIAEDSHGRITAIQGVSELLGEYSRAFADVIEYGVRIIEEELVEAVRPVKTRDGRETGEPKTGMRVAAAGGDILITKKAKTTTTYDMGQVVAALALKVAADHGIVDPSPELLAYAGDLASRLDAFYGAKKPNITQVKAFADELARDGDHSTAAAVRAAISTDKKYTGITVKREAPKPAKIPAA